MKTWIVRISSSAQHDFDNIVAWTAEHFGIRQASTYAATLSLAIAALMRGPQQTGVRQRDDILHGAMTFHVARRGRRGRHFIVVRVMGNRPRPTIEILRILHDAMDLPRHVPGAD